MEIIKRDNSGPAVEDIQQRLIAIGLLDEWEADGAFGELTGRAVREFCKKYQLPETEEVDERVWSALVDASFSLGDRTLYLRMPYFHGHDVLELQRVLSVLGFACGVSDGIFGAFTELALRKFQLNMGLPSDGIAGAYTYAALRNLHHSWTDKEAVNGSTHLGFARAADVLESNALCLFGTQAFTRSVASRMSNLALATNPASKIVSADLLSVAPDEKMLLVHIVLPDEATSDTPRVIFEEESTLSLRLETAIGVADASSPSRIAVELPGAIWEDAGEGRSAQHFAIALLDALCSALS